MDLKKVKAVEKWPTPKSVTKVGQFLGFAGYYKKFVKDFSKISKLLTQLAKKGENFVWTKECEAAFLELKHRLTTHQFLIFQISRVVLLYTMMLQDRDLVM